jgi:hypothetical protein
MILKLVKKMPDAKKPHNAVLSVAQVPLASLWDMMKVTCLVLVCF